jgi:ankyrin repeat protein
MRLYRPEDPESESDPRLIKAVKQGNVAAVRNLLRAGAMVNSRDEEEFTALMIAAGAGHVEIFNLLLRAEADPFLTAFGESALTLACVEGQLEIVKSWIVHGLNIASDGDDGIQALIAAASGGHVEIVRLLADVGVRANQEAIDYATELGDHALSALRDGGALAP